MGVQSHVAGRWVEVLAEACEGAKHGEEKACLDCLITKNRPEGGLERAQRIIHHVQGQHPPPLTCQSFSGKRKVSVLKV
jgi:hypothetical protein